MSKLLRVSRYFLALFIAFLTCSLQIQAQNSPVQINSVKLIADRTGWLIANNRLFWTDSLGSSWTEITPASSHVSSVYFGTSGPGWALTTDAAGAIEVQRTADKGAHWNGVSIPSPYEDGLSFSGRSSISFVDATHGFVMLKTQSSSSSSMGVLFATSDGGAHWTRLPDPPVGGDIFFLDTQHGFAGPGPMGNELYSTADGGTTWHLAYIGPASEPGEITLPIFSDSTHAYVLKTVNSDAGTSVVRYTTEDGGVTWSKADTVAQNATHARVAVAANGSVVTSLNSRKISANSLTPSQDTSSQIQNPVLASFGSQNDGLVLFQGGGCTNGACTQTQSLMGTMDGGKTYFSLALPGDLQTESAHSFNVAPSAKGSGWVANYLKPDGSISAVPLTSATNPATGVMGYDTCAIMSATQMQDWYTNSPYKVAGIYIGGADWGCRNGGAPSATQISTALSQGWGIIPIWVGPQANTNQAVLLPTTTTAAYTTGVTEADSAVAVAASVGISQGAIIYYDMEAYSRSSTNIAITQAFLNGWFAELHTKGYLGAVYSSHPELQDWEPSKMTTPPDVIWFAWFFNSGVACGTQCQTVYGVSDIPDNLWTDHHRVRQTSSGFHSTYGSTTYNIDEDWADAPVNFNGLYTATVVKSGTGTGTVTSSDAKVNCGSFCVVSYSSTASVTFTAAAATGSNFTSWSGCDSVSGNTCTVSIAANRSVTATFTKVPVTPTIAWTPATTSTTFGTALGTGVLNATAAYNGSPVAGTFTYMATYTGGTLPVTAATVLPVGTYSMAVTFIPTDATSYNNATGALASFVVNKATPTVTLTPSVTTLFQGKTTNVLVAVNGVSGLPPTGSVALMDGSTQIATSPLTQGAVAFSGVALAIGAHSLTVQYAGDLSYAAVTSSATTVTVNPPAFIASSSSSSLTISVQQGHSQTANVSFTPEGSFTGTIALACTGLPASATCAFNPASLTGDGTGVTTMSTALTITATTSAQVSHAKSGGIFFALLLLPVFFAPFKSNHTLSARRLLAVLILLAGGVTATSLIGCGGSSSPSAPSGPIYSGTVHVSATSGSTTVQIPVQLTITR